MANDKLERILKEL